ncbi:polysaccharide biosynthesis/export family protein [Sandaracinobacter neustonicus]|nr:polysaccharide biosynthesis/export family protein [Sandaracinobacter neustonicus]
MAGKTQAHRIAANSANSRCQRGLVSLGLAVALAVAAPSALFAQAATPSAATPSPTAPPVYILGPSDGISVIVYGQSEFNVSTRVKPDGSIVMPLIGKVQAEGKTVITLADEITRRLVQGNFLKDPIVNIEVSDYASNYIRIIGKVGSPGLIPLDKSNRLMDVLLRSGWVQEAGNNTITLRRAAGGDEQKINTEDLAMGKVPDVILQNGDVIIVPEAEVIYLTGAVARPGTYPLKRDMTMSELLAMAGGVGPTGSSGKFGLKRGDAKEVNIDGTEVLKAGDVVRVKERMF